jgi:hypothetical protein
MQKSIRVRSIDGFKKGAFVLALSLLLANAPEVFAHGGAEHVMGKVTKVSAQSVTVETTDKKVVEVGLNSKTTYTRNDKKVPASDLKIGERVMIEAKEVNEKLVAGSVKLGTVATKSEPAAHK